MNSQDNGIAVITGASSGIGALYAERFARRGHDVILVARKRERLERVAQRIAEASGRNAQILVADLNDPGDLAHVETVLRGDPRIRVLVNNAGFGATASLLASDPLRMEEMIALNVTALSRLTHAVAPGLVARGGGAIINIASIVAIAPELLNGVYGGTKAFVLAFSQSLHHQLADKGVRVQVVLPGATATEFWDVAGTPVAHLPDDIVMRAEDMVDAALKGFDQGEVVTIPSLPDVEDWHAFEAARRALGPGLSRSVPAPRYGSSG